MLGAGSSVRIRIGGRARSPTNSPVDVTNKWSSHSQDKVRIKYSVYVQVRARVVDPDPDPH
jgi:hypothetical protein